MEVLCLGARFHQECKACSKQNIMNYFKIKHSAGFTLIELLVVIAIIGVLSGIVLQSLKGARQRSQNATRLSDIDQINKALELYFTKQNNGVGTFPTTGGLWNCIGLSSGVCWGLPGPGSIPAPTGAQNTPATNINLAITGNISKIPRDPNIAAGSPGDYYVYNPSWTWPIATSPVPAPPTGAYLAWLVNDIGQKPCGRGIVYTPASYTGFKECLLYLGK